MKIFKIIIISLIILLFCNVTMITYAADSNNISFSSTDSAKTITLDINGDYRELSCEIKNSNIVNATWTDVEDYYNYNSNKVTFTINPKLGGTTQLIFKIKDTVICTYDVIVYRKISNIDITGNIYKSNIKGASYINFDNIPSYYNINISFDNGENWLVWKHKPLYINDIYDSAMVYISSNDEYNYDSDKYNININTVNSTDKYSLKACYIDTTVSSITASAICYLNDRQIELPDFMNIEYSIDGINYSKNNIFNNLRPNTTYTIYARLTGTNIDGSIYNSDIDKITVPTKISYEITISQTLKQGIIYEITDIDFSKALIWSNDEDIATINKDGEITAIDIGFTEIHIVIDKYEYIYKITVIKNNPIVIIEDDPTPTPSPIDTPTPTPISTDDDTDPIIPSLNPVEPTTPTVKPTNTPTKSSTDKHTTKPTNNDNSAPKVVTKIKCTTKKNSIKITYKKLKDVKYQIQISTSKQFNRNVNTYSTSKTKYMIKNLKKNKKYYIRVRSYKKFKKYNLYSSWSKVKKVKTKKK